VKPITTIHRAIIIGVLACISLLPMPGCGGSSSALVLESNQGIITPTIVSAVYRFIDQNTADIYLSDFPLDEIAPRLDQGVIGQPGNIIHIRLFLMPKVGKTPLDSTASNASITHMVLTGNSMGVYGGGGFLFPSDKVGDPTFSGTIRDATLRIIDSEPGFVDRLGRCTFGGTLSVERDDERTAAISVRFARLLNQ